MPLGVAQVPGWQPTLASIWAIRGFMPLGVAQFCLEKLITLCPSDRGFMPLGATYDSSSQPHWVS